MKYLFFELIDIDIIDIIDVIDDDICYAIK